MKRAFKIPRKISRKIIFYKCLDRKNSSKSRIFLCKNFEAEKFDGQVFAGVMAVGIRLVVILVKIEIEDGIAQLANVIHQQWKR